MLSIGEVSEATGLAASALRYYEQIGLIPAPSRKGGKRVYPVDVLGRIEVIRLAQSAGFHMSETKWLLEGFDSNVPPSDRWRAMAETKRNELDERIAKLLKMRDVLDNSMKCDCLSWDECFVAIRRAETAIEGGGR